MRADQERVQADRAALNRDAVAAITDRAFRMILDAQDDLEVVAEAADGEEGVTAVPDAGPTSCSWTSGCPGGTGWRRPVDPPERVPCRVIVLTTFDLDAYVYAALRAGASGLLLKDPSPERLATAVRMIVAGDAILAPGITRRLVERFARQVVAAAPGRSGLAHGARARGTPAGGARAEQRRDRGQAPPG